jgi:hypothetical protein
MSPPTLLDPKFDSAPALDFRYAPLGTKFRIAPK